MKKIILMALMAVSLSACGFQTVDQGNTGVKKTLGKVDPDPKEPGFYTYSPFMSSMIEMDNHVQKFEAKSNVYTKDVQQADISFALNYALKADHSVWMYSNVGKQWEDTIIPQVINGAMKNVIGKWDAIELVSNRDKAADAIQAQIVAALATYGVSVTGFQLTNVQFQPEFEKAVEAKVIAVQKAEQAKNETVQVQEQANQTVISAKASAEAMKIKSEALSQNQNLVQYEMVQKWNGVLPQIQSGNGGMMLNLPVMK